jgi:hypothetical protein
LALDPVALDLAPEAAVYLRLPLALLAVQIGVVAARVGLTLRDRGNIAQVVLLGVTAVSAVVVLGVYGFTLMAKANPLLRELAVVQVLLVLSCLLTVLVIDMAMFRGAREIGGIEWGKMTVRSQYVLVLLCVTVVLLMGLMGYLRSAGREEWHVYELMKDTSAGAYTPTMAHMTRVVGVIVGMFMALMTFVFWLGSLGDKKSRAAADDGNISTPSIAGD